MSADKCVIFTCIGICFCVLILMVILKIHRDDIDDIKTTLQSMNKIEDATDEPTSRVPFTGSNPVPSNINILALNTKINYI